MSRTYSSSIINAFVRGAIYDVIADDGSRAHGRYLGIEVIYDDWAVLLQDTDRVHSIAIVRLASVDRVTDAA